MRAFLIGLLLFGYHIISGVVSEDGDQCSPNFQDCFQVYISSIVEHIDEPFHKVLKYPGYFNNPYCKVFC
jgi:hypothetical protein